MAGYERPRRRMVDVHVAGRGIRDPHVLAAMRRVPRERFVPAGMAEWAYEDAPLPIGEGQTISQPYVVARMIEAAGVRPGGRVLEVGAGSGYAAALLAEIAAEVFAVERHEALGVAAAERLRALGYANVALRIADGTAGWPEAAPFDAILVSAGGPEVPAALKAQLAPGGSLVMPVGGEDAQRLLRIARTGAGAAGFRQEDLGGVRFVPLIGAGGWAEDGGPPAGSPVPGRA